jgi:hypothetical protein
MANTREPSIQPIPILSLRPTQMTVGMREVKEKRKRWRDHKSKKKQSELLGKHMIPVVQGPDQRYYVIDHHHLARALHDEGVKDILVTVVADLTMVEKDAFWGVLDNKRWVYPYDAKGERRHFSEIPKTIRSAVWPVNCAAPAALPRTPRRSANSSGRISCAAGCRARAWKPISKKPSRKPWRWPKARTPSICPAGADPRRMIEGGEWRMASGE